MSRPWDDDDDDYVLPLEDQRVFGAGIKRKRVPFVRASGDLQTTSTRQDAELASSSASVADRYFSIVMSKKKRMEDAEEARKKRETEDVSISIINERDSLPASTDDTENDKSSHTKTQTAPVDLCELCKLPLSISPTEDDRPSGAETPETTFNTKRATPHEASIAHQVCLEHSHPPSHLDRTRHGLRYLAAYGWDPDSRVGLGVDGRTGIREPIKPKAKNDTIGLGMAIDDKNNTAAARQKLRKQQQEQRQKLNAKQVRGAQMADRMKGDQLRELFYGSDDIQRYLGGG